MLRLLCVLPGFILSVEVCDAEVSAQAVTKA
jgi:hypothetical protein